MEKIKEFLSKIANSYGISGFEYEIGKLVKTEFEKYCDEVNIDKLGNVIGLKKGKGKGKLMYAAHIDEIGLMVTEIDDKGFVYFVNIGGYDQRTLLGQEVIIHGLEPVYGLIGTKAFHANNDDIDKSIPINKMFIDTGLTKDKLSKIIRIGNQITIKREVNDLLNGRIYGKTLDDRAGVASLVLAMMDLKNVICDYDVYFVATTQEEVGSKGGQVASNFINPDIAIAIDVGFGKTPELKDHESLVLGKGAGIATGCNINPIIFNLLKDTAKENYINYQIDVSPSYTSTDTEHIQISNQGVATGLLSIPLKYMHTSVELMDMKDLYSTGKLLACFARHLDDKELEVKICY